MEKLKLTEIQKFQLLDDAYTKIVSQGRYCYSFIHPLDCDKIKFNCGAFSKKNGARVEVVYKYRNCTIKLLWLYTRRFIDLCNLYDSVFSFVPKAITIEREFKGSILISILPDLECMCKFIYQSTKCITELCEEDSDEGDAEDARVGVCLAEVDDDSTTLKNENVTL